MSQYYNYYGAIKPEHAGSGYYQQPPYTANYAPVVFATPAVAKPVAITQPSVSNVSTAFINPQVQSTVNYGAANVGYAAPTPYYAPTATKVPPLSPYPSAPHISVGKASSCNSNSQHIDAVLQAYACKAAFSGSSSSAPVVAPSPVQGGTTVYRSRAQAVIQGQPKSFRRKPSNSGGGESVFFCDVCMISCASALTYKDHLQGQPHKKKEMQAQNSKTPTPGGKNFFCEMCSVSCTGYDAYQAHIVGAKHKKRQKLLQQLGKPIPIQSITPNPPASIALKSAPTDVREKAAESGLSSTEGGPAPVGESYVKEIFGTDGKFLTFECQLCECKFNDAFARNMHLKGRRHRLEYKRKVDPKLEVETKPMSAREKHSHRLLEEKRKQFAEQRTMTMQMNELKKVEMAGGFVMSPAPKFRMGPGGKMHPVMTSSVIDRMVMSKKLTLQMDPDERRTFQEFMKYCSKVLNYVAERLDCQLQFHDSDLPGTSSQTQIKQMNSVDKEEMAVQLSKASCTQSASVELSAKIEVANTVDDVDSEKSVAPEGEVECDFGKAEAPNDGVKQDRREHECCENASSVSGYALEDWNRCLKNVLFTDNYAKKICISGDQDMQVVVLSAQWPTLALVRALADAVKRTMQLLPKIVDCVFQLSEDGVSGQFVSLDSYSFRCHVLLTSPVVRELLLRRGCGESSAGSPCDMKTEICQNAETTANANLPLDRLDQNHCLHNLALTRRAKWFQSKLSMNLFAITILKVLRELCQRVPAWLPLSDWALELLVERSLSSSVGPLSVGTAFRRVFECVSSGILLTPFGPGLTDPCEKGAPDTLTHLTLQEREDITSYAQYALRCIAFGKIHIVLDLEPNQSAESSVPAETSPSTQQVQNAFYSTAAGTPRKRKRSSDEDSPTVGPTDKRQN